MATPSCRYCGCTAPNCLAQCAATGWYFCNGKGSTTRSHIIEHLHRIGADQIRFPETNDFATTELKCYQCECTNVFKLGFVVGEDSKYFIVCRSPCLDDPEFVARAKPQRATFEPLVRNHELYPAIVNVPSPGEYHSVPIETIILMRDEALQQLNPTDAAPRPGRLSRARLHYDSVEDYIQVMTPFVNAEQQECSVQLRARRAETLRFEWLSGTDVRFRCSGAFFKGASLGSCVRISRDDASEDGRVVERTRTMFVTIRLDHAPLFQGCTQGLTVAAVFNKVPFQRQLAALRSIASERPPLHWLILDLFLGCTEKLAKHNRVKHNRVKFVPPAVPDFPTLNEPQLKAVNVAISQRLTLVQGPPGTGKTTVIAALAHSFVRSGVRPILVCALSNVATDFVTLRLDSIGLNVCRVLAHAREGIAGDVEPLTTRARAAERFGIDADWDTADPATRRAIVDREARIVHDSDVVCATCVSAGGARLNDTDFKVVIFDEAGQCLDPDLLIALTHGAEQAVLVGDHKQLRPLVLSREAARAGYDLPLIERLVCLNVHPSVLRVQYRMHPAISQFPSEVFYAKLITDGVTEDDRVWDPPPLPWPRADRPVLFWNVESREEVFDLTTSFMNSTEAVFVAKVVDRLYDAGVEGASIGVITPYTGQQSHLVEMLPTLCAFRDDAFFADLEIASVDSFQGREKDFVIFNTVRANEDHAIGFLADLKRLCVSLTRAKYGLVIIGNAKTFATCMIWVSLIENYIDNGAFVQGPSLDELVQCPFTSLVAQDDKADEEIDYNADRDNDEY